MASQQELFRHCKGNQETPTKGYSGTTTESGQAQGLAFISPVWFVGFPAILKGWIERVFTLDFAFSLSPEGWRGKIEGRIRLLKHEKH